MILKEREKRKEKEITKLIKMLMEAIIFALLNNENEKNSKTKHVEKHNNKQ